MKKNYFYLFLWAIVLVLSGCEKYEIINQYLTINPIYEDKTSEETIVLVYSITLSSSTLSLMEGNTAQLTATINPSNATNKSIIWSTSNANVAEVSNNGLVTAGLIGTAIITATAADESGVKGICTVTVTSLTSGINNGHDWVDLGLSVKWATMNVGAFSSENDGEFFAWGEITTKNTYDWTSYKYCNGSSNSLTKYNNSSSYGSVDNKITLDSSDDVASVNWGSTWRMPTYDEWNELKTKCTWIWTTQNGKNGYKVVGVNTASIFLPASGYYYVTSLYDIDKNGYYWSSSLRTAGSYNAYYLFFNSDNVNWGNGGRCYGRSIRAVCQ